MRNEANCPFDKLLGGNPICHLTLCIIGDAYEQKRIHCGKRHAQQKRGYVI